MQAHLSLKLSDIHNIFHVVYFVIWVFQNLIYNIN